MLFRSRSLVYAYFGDRDGLVAEVYLRVLRELAEADLVLCEDTRHTRVLLERHGIKARLLSYHEHNEARRVAEVLPRLAAGERVALVSDAGLPAISDPGARLIAAAREGGVPVTVLPGPSAVETALVASGFESERFQFVGFLPRGARQLADLWGELAQWRHALVAFESPQRIGRSLASLAEALPDRPVAVCRELTKRFEEVVRGPAAEVAEGFADATKGEITIVIGPSEAAGEVADEGDALRAVAELVAGGTPRRTAAEVVSRLTGIPRNRLYRASL